MALAVGANGVSRGYLGGDIVASIFLGSDPVLSPGKSLQAEAGSYALSGGAITRRRSMVFEPGAFVLTGQSAGMSRGHMFAAATGSFALAGQQVDFRKLSAASLERGLFNVTGQPSDLRKASILRAANGAFGLVGGAAGLLRSRLLPAASGTFALAGQDAGLSSGVIADPVTKSYIGGTSGKIVTGTSVSCGPAFSGRRVFVGMTGQLASGTVTGVTIGGVAATIHAVAYGSWSQYGNATTVLASADLPTGTAATVKVSTTEGVDRLWYFDTWAVGNLSSTSAIAKKEVTATGNNSADMSVATVPDGVVFVAAGLFTGGQPDISGATRDYRANINANYLRRLGGSALTTASETRAISVYLSSSQFIGPLVSASFR